MVNEMNMAELMAVVTAIPGSAAAEAVEAAHLAQEVKESIPEDYSELSADVAEIKGAYAAKTDTVLETTLSRGRKDGTTVGNASFAFGSGVTASAYASHAEGTSNTASGESSHVEGGNNIASGQYSHAEGGYVTSGRGNQAIGTASHAEGARNIANGDYSHVEGYYNVLNGSYAHVGGKFSVEDTYDSWAEWTANTPYIIGDKVKVTNDGSVSGYVCKVDNSDAEFDSLKWSKVTYINYANIVGNGTANNARSNAYALDWDGNGHYMGDVYVGCNADSTGGTKLVKDVQVNGVSVVTDGVANVPAADGANIYGVVKVNNNETGGIKIQSGTLSTAKATESEIKAGVQSRKPIVPVNQHESTFYGLSKAAGADLKDETVTVGTYPAAAIDKILAMLGVIDIVAPHEATSTASKAYSVGDAFIYAGKLYKVTVDIESGGTITPDTNCTQTTLVELMKG